MAEPQQFVHTAPAPALRNHVTGYYGFLEDTTGPVRRLEGPGTDVVVIVSFGEEWLINGELRTSFVGGLHEAQVETEHAGRSYGMQINLRPPSAFMLFGLPLDTLAQRTVPLEDVLGDASLVERLHDAGEWSARFDLIETLLAKRLDRARAPSAGIVWAWRQLAAAHGNVRIAALARELGWSRRRLVARFREQVGLPPKAVARLLRFEHARALAEQAERPDWARIAVECGYYDQSHLINDFRAITRRTPATFFQDVTRAAA
jgi:AraC-like DNA-binding protein